MATRVTVKGQVTIPKPIRDKLGIVAGDAVEFHLRPNGVAEIRRSEALRTFEKTLERLRRKPPIAKFTTDEIMRMTRGENS